MCWYVGAEGSAQHEHVEAVYCQALLCLPQPAGPVWPLCVGPMGPQPGVGAGDCWETGLAGPRALLLSHALFSVCFSPEQGVWMHGGRSIQILRFEDSLKPCPSSLDSLELCPQPVTAWSAGQLGAGSWMICKELFGKGEPGKHPPRVA